MRRLPRGARSQDAGVGDYESGLADLQEILSRSARASGPEAGGYHMDRLQRDPPFGPNAHVGHPEDRGAVQLDDEAGGRLPAPYFLDDRAYGGEAMDVDWPLRRRRSLSSRLLMITLAAAGLAVLFALFTSDVTRAVFANARLSVTGVTASPVAPRAPDPTQLTASDLQLREPDRPVVPSTRALDGFASAALASPRTDSSASGFATALAAAGERDIAAVPAGDPALPMRRLGSDEIATLMRLSRVMIVAGDVPAARLLLESAAGSQHAEAALLLAQSYDPRPLAKDAPRGRPDPLLARTWYERAAQLGSPEAQRRLAQLQSDAAAGLAGIQVPGKPVPPAPVTGKKTASAARANPPAQAKR